MRSRYVGPLQLPVDVFQRLEQRARAEERDALQQARWILAQALTAEDPAREAPTTIAETAPAGTSR